MLTSSVDDGMMRGERRMLQPELACKRRAGETITNRMMVVNVDEMKPMAFKEGQVVDVKKLLSSNDRRDYLVSPKTGRMVPISILDGKYVLVCSFTLLLDDPFLQCLDALYSKPWNDALQFVLLLDHNMPCIPPDYLSFFHTLSFDCLTIPLSHHFDNVSFLALDPSGRVLVTTPLSLYMYGAESFPFSNYYFDINHHYDLYIKSCLSNTTNFPLITLEELFHCNSLPLLGLPYHFKPTSSLYNKPVGLYLYYSGDCLDFFLNIHQQCLSKGLDFEFILVPIPFSTRRPDDFVTRMTQSVLTSCPTSSWLTFPFNDKICRTFWRLYDCLPSDQLIIMPHAGRAGDLNGRSILHRYGILSYPFTPHVILDKKVTHLRSKTLESLLGDHHGSEIRNKNVVLYIINLDHFMEFRLSNIGMLYQDTQLYTLPLGPASCHAMKYFGFKVVPEEKWESVIDHIFMTKDPLCKERPQEAIVTFGKDGKVLSRYKYDDLDFFATDSRFDDILTSQILSEIQREIDID